MNQQSLDHVRRRTRRDLYSTNPGGIVLTHVFDAREAAFGSIIWVNCP